MRNLAWSIGRNTQSKNVLEFANELLPTLEILNLPKKGQLTVRETTKCDISYEFHNIHKCNKLKTLSLEQRQETVRKQRSCYNSLRKGHTINNCPSKSRCRTCVKRHHTLLHTNYLVQPNETISTSHRGTTRRVWIPVCIDTTSLELTTLRALDNSGSHRTLNTESTTQLLDLKNQYSGVQIYGLGAAVRAITRIMTRLQLKTRTGDQFINVVALVAANITNIHLAVPTKIKLPQRLSCSDLIDPSCGMPDSN